MATDISDIVKQGYLRVKSKTVGVWQKRWIVLRRASSKGPCRMEKYLDEKNARNGLHLKTLFLSNVLNISRLPPPNRKHSFAVNINDVSCKLFASESDLEADCWVKLLIQECLIPKPGLATGEPDVLSPGIQKELQEQFHVYLMPTPKLDVFGECVLQVTHENIYLWDVLNPKVRLVAWPLTALRRYGSDPTKFTFEAGRHCATGEGMFVFHTLEGEKIYRKVHQATLAIAEAHQKTRKFNQITHENSLKPSLQRTISAYGLEQSDYKVDCQCEDEDLSPSICLHHTSRRCIKSTALRGRCSLRNPSNYQ